MTLNLSKGQRIDLTKGTDIKKINVCLGWDVKQSSQKDDYDLDASAFLLTANGKPANESDVVFYGQKEHISGAVKHSGDDRTGAGNITHSTDKEIIGIDLDKVPKDKEKIVFVVSIYDAKTKNQNFGQISNAFIRVVNVADNKELMRYNLTEDYSTSTALIVGEVYRNKADWKFAALDQGLLGGLEQLAISYGLEVKT